MLFNFYRIYILFILSVFSVCIWAENTDSIAEHVYPDYPYKHGALKNYVVKHTMFNVDSVPKHIYSIGGNASINHLFNIEIRGEKLVKRGWGGNYGLFMDSQANPLDKEISVYDRVFGFPTLEAGVQLLDFSHVHLHTGDTPYISGMGLTWAAYIAFRRDVYRNKKWSYGYSLENGLSLSSRTYEGDTNVDNDFIGQHLSVYFGCGLFAGYRISPETEIAVSVDYKHVSNGATDRPNKGANLYAMGLRARCDLNRPKNDNGLTFHQRRDRLAAFKREQFMPYMYFDINAAVGFRTMYDEWLWHREYMHEGDPGYLNGNLALHNVWSATFVPMFRYNQVHASGVGLEYMFAGYAKRSQYVEQQIGITRKFTHSKHVLSIAGYHEVYYKNVSLHMSVGAYLYRKLGWVSHTYEPGVIETVGLRYYPKFFRPFYLGYNLKANLGKAYAMEIRAGLHVGHWNLKKQKKEVNK